MNVIMRPACNRPEMLYLSLEYELKARKYYKFSSDLLTIFVLDYGYDDKILEIINQYPYKKYVIKRDKKFGLSMNILEGMKEAFKHADDYVIYIEDDMLVHQTYFKFIDVLMSIVNFNEYSVIIGYSKGIHNKDGNFETPTANVNLVHKDHAYAAYAPVIKKTFFNEYILPCVSSVFYRNFSSREKFVVELGNKYKDDARFKYRGNLIRKHNEQAGLINRLVDVAFIQEGLYTLRPEVTRVVHIGFYGKNRPGSLYGNSFEERLNLLRDAIINKKLYEMTSTKQYNDYEYFSTKLDEWDGNLYVK